MIKNLLAASTAVYISMASLITPSYSQAQAPSTKPVDRPSMAVPGDYIVVFKSTVKNPRAELDSLNRGGKMKVKHVYDVALKGFAAKIPDAALKGLLNNPRIDYIEQDQTVSMTATVSQSPTPSWGIDRVDQPRPVSNTPYDNTYHYDYNGTGVTAYVIDTGIRSTHNELKTSGISRVKPGFSAIAGGTEDCNGHGTHVAGTIGGTTTGVAKGVDLVPVRVLDCNGSGAWSSVIAGINWVAANAAGKKTVANMSLGGGASSALDSAVRNAIASGVTFVVAAGNSGRDAKNYSPARVAEAITVGATAYSDTRASYSNYGSVVDIFAPGTSITSSWYTSDIAVATISGTSMAAPHVAGSVALLLQEKNLLVASGTPSAVRSQLVTDAEKDLVLNTRGNPNNFLNTNYSKVR